MSRPGVTYGEIADAATYLIGEGKNPTIEHIRQMLGTGSSTTIANHLKKWKESQQSHTLVALKENIPQELIEVLAGLWGRVITLSDDHIQHIEIEFKDKQIVLETELNKYKSNNQRWQKMYEQWQSEKELLSNELKNLHTLNQVLHAQQLADKTKLETQKIYLNEKQIQIDESNKLLQLTQEKLTAVQEKARIEQLMLQEKHNTELSVFTEKVNQLENKFLLSERDNQNLTQQLCKLDQTLVDAKQERENIKIELQQWQTKYRTQEKELIEMNQKNIFWDKQCTQIQTKLEKAQTQFQESEKNNTSLQSMIATLKEQCEELKVQNKNLLQEKFAIAEEKAQLLGRLKQTELA